MNDNTIIRIKVPAHLYESVKAKLMIKEEASVAETKVEETETLEESPIVDILTGLAGAAGLGLTGAAIAKAQDWLKDKNPELYKTLQNVHGAIGRAKGLNEAKKEEDKKAEDKKKAEEKKKKEAEAKKVADKKKK